MLKLDELMTGSTKESAYTLGFLWGDGYIYKKIEKSIYKISISILEEDMSDISHTIQSTGDWTSSSFQQKNRRKQGLLCVNNKKFTNFLFDNGYGPNTTGSAKNILNIIDPIYRNYWFRGLIDADGCFYNNQKNYVRHFSLCSCYEQEWDFLTDLFDNLSIFYTMSRRIEYPNSVKPQKHSVVRISNVEGIKKLGNYLYGIEYDSIGFSRKYKKWLEICQSQIKFKRDGR